MMLSTCDHNIACLTIWAEARSESEEGQAAVAWVILHRAHNPRWWGRNGVADVCLFRKGRFGQFSCWNADNPQRARMLRMLVGGDTAAGVLTMEGVETTERQRNILNRVLRGEIADPTKGATHYLTHAAARTAAWAVGNKPRAVIGGHLFFGPEDLGEAAITPWSPPVIHTPRPAPSGGVWSAIWRFLATIFGGRKDA